MRKIFWVALCWLASVTWAHAAPQVLFLSPDESKPVGRPVSQADWSFTNNAYNAFSAQVGAANIHDGRRVLDSATPDLSLFNGVQLVVITTTYAVISPEWRTELNTLMLNRPDLTFVFYPDGCCNDATNLQPILDTINIGTNWGVTRTGSNISGDVTSRLNTNSLYQGSFSSLQTMEGGDYQLVNNVPPDNALYTIRSASSSPPVATPGLRVSAYGFFVAQQSFNQGQGSCIFLTADISPFVKGTQPQQSDAIAAAFVDAATNPNGACKQATREPDLTVALSGPGTLDLGATGNFSMAIANQGASDSSNGVVSIPLPAGFTVSGFPTSQPPGVCSVTAGALTCSLGALVATTGTTTIAFQGVAQQPGPISLTASITGVTGETNTSNNSSTLPVATQAPNLSVAWTSSNTGEPWVAQPFSLSVSNAGPAPSQGGSLSINVPSDVVVDPASLLANCSLAGNVLTCSLPPLAAGASTSIAFSGKPSFAGSPVLTATISGVPYEANTADNTASLTVLVSSTPVAKEVPSLGAWALALLAAALAGVPALRRRPG